MESGLLSRLYGKLRRLNRHLYRSDRRFAEEDHRREFMRRAFHALSFNGISGDYAEFGSHGGTTFALAHAEIQHWKRPRMMWAFDSFQGLPDQQQEEDYHPGWKKGKMSTSLDSFHQVCRRRGIENDQYRVVAGYYGDTLAGRAPDDPDLPSDIALAYIDCDLYSSTRTVLEFLEPRLKQGMIIAFDDYFCFSDRTLAGERKAMLDIFHPDSDYALCPYVQFGWHGLSFVVEENQLLASSRQS